MKYYIGQVFENDYPNEAVKWANEHGAYILQNGTKFTILEIPAPSLDEIKQAKLASLKSMRDSLEVEPIFYNGHYFDYDEKARDRINAAIISLDLLGEGTVISWTTADNTEAIVSANDLRGVIGAVAIRSNELHIKYRRLRELVDKAKTVAEVETIVW